MTLVPGKGHSALRRGRWSDSGAEYFLTICVADKKNPFIDPSAAKAITRQALALQREAVWRVRTLVVMPDHVHLLVTLGAIHNLSNAIRLFKGRSSVILRDYDAGWQRGCFDHRIRADEDRLPVFDYVFLNPYRADLLQQDRPWPDYYCDPDDWNWFGPLTDSGLPYPQWLQ